MKASWCWAARVMINSSKASLSAYQRWELASLAETGETEAAAPQGTGAPRAQPAANDTVNADPVEQTQAYAQGFATGYAEGHAQGLAAGHTEGVAAGQQAGHAEGMAQAQEARARLEALIPSLAENAGAQRQVVLDEVLSFALAVAQQMVGRALEVRRELVLPTIAAALERLPQMSQNVQLALNPLDLDTVRAFLADATTPATCTLVADPAITPGGCRLSTEQCDVDATVETRWRRLVANLGSADEWLAAR